MKGKLPRLNPERYRGRAYVFWTHTTINRGKLPLGDLFHTQFREVLTHTCARYRLAVPVYCLMLDHVHLLMIGLGEDSDQRNATKFLRGQLSPLIQPTTWQRQPHDHVVTEDERSHDIFADSINYILQNPVRAGIVQEWKEYSYLGCLVAGYPSLDRRDPKFLEIFWRIVNSSSDC